MELLAKLEDKYQLPSGLLSAVMKQESGGNINAVSPKGARGAFQFMPATAKQYGVDVNSLESSADGAARMYSDLLKLHNGDVDKALASYNWGQGNVAKKGMDKAPKETRDYITKIKSNMPKHQSSEYIDDPELLAQLNADDGYVTDEALLAQLNAEEPTVAPSVTEPQDKGIISNYIDNASISNVPQNTANLVGGAISGATKLGSLVTNPLDMVKSAIAGEGLTGAKRNIASRQAGVKGGLQTLGADTDSAGFKVAEVGAEIAGTSGIPVALGGRVAKELPKLGSAIKSGGLTLGGKAATTAGQKVANAAIRGVGGAVSGGAMTLAVDPEKTGTGAAIGVAIPVVGMAAGAVGKKLGERAASKAQALAPRQQEFAVAKEANKLGYVIPPADLRPSAMSELASGVSGKIKTAQVASQRNQLVTNSLVKKSLGLSDDAPLNAETLNQIRQEAGNAYQSVADIGTVTPSAKYAADLDEAIKPFIKQAQSFPNRKVSAVVDDIQSLKTGSFDAGDAIETIKVLRNDADAAYRSGDKLAGKAYKKAAETLENAIDDQLVVNGVSNDVLNSYRNARKTIAKTYTVEGALNAQTGNVNAAKLATQLNKKKPLDGELLQVAKIANAFPKATQMLKETPKAISPLDFYAAGGVAAGTGNVLPLAMIGARPAIRGALLSKTAQRSAIKGLDKTSMATKLLSKAPNTKAAIGVARSVPIASLYE